MWSDLASFLSEQCEIRHVSWREASLGAGLDHGAISRFIKGQQPSTESCKKLSSYFKVSEDTLLSLAGHRDIGDQELDPEIVAIAKRIGKVPPDRRNKVMRTVLSILEAEEE